MPGHGWTLYQELGSNLLSKLDIVLQRPIIFFYSLCVFTHHVPVVGSGPPPIKLRKIVDLAPITITDQVNHTDTIVIDGCAKQVYINLLFSDPNGDCG